MGPSPKPSVANLEWFPSCPYDHATAVPFPFPVTLFAFFPQSTPTQPEPSSHFTPPPSRPRRPTPATSAPHRPRRSSQGKPPQLDCAPGCMYLSVRSVLGSAWARSRCRSICSPPVVLSCYDRGADLVHCFVVGGFDRPLAPPCCVLARFAAWIE